MQMNSSYLDERLLPAMVKTPWPDLQIPLTWTDAPA